ncbi:hypothetical protein A2U01_0045497, partial [Trifolium medium]|nr:hypothetical protein [Trifolium medium]
PVGCEQQGWVSLKHQSEKIFKMFVESARGFKERYYVVKSVTQFARDSLYVDKKLTRTDGSPLLDEHEVQRTRRVARFLLSWSDKHFSICTEEFLMADESLTDGERAGFEKLKAYVATFKPTRFLTKTGEVAVNKYGKPIIEARYVSTRKLLACKSTEEATLLLGILIRVF